MKPSLFGRTLSLIMISVTLASALFILIAVVLTDRLLIDSTSAELSTTCLLAGTMLEGINSETSMEMEVGRIAETTGYRVTLIAEDGKVVADSAVSPASMENHGKREEIQGALSGKSTKSVRKSTTTGMRMLYSAIPLHVSGRTFALRLAMPLPPSIGRLTEAKWLFLLFVAVIIGVSLIASHIINRQITLPVRHIVEKAKVLARGSAQTEKPSIVMPIELKIIDDSLDMLVDTIQERTSESEKIDKRLSSILEAAGEGIIATDESLKIIEANSAAGKLFSSPTETLIGKSILEALENREIENLFRDCLEKNEELFRSVRVFGGESLRHIKIHASPFDQGMNSGVVAVFGDYTELERLEKVRKDFVANVSHELRTPIQIIKGYAELLTENKTDQEAGSRYLEIICHNTMRMERIINDLLMVARLEGDPGSWKNLESCDLIPSIVSSIQTIQPLADQKKIEIQFDHPPSLPCMANAGLIEQAVFNLLDNAVNYSPPSRNVIVSIKEIEGGLVEISVSDKGIGIPAKDIDRIFERFYRVDKSRSKKTGGTGLGLSIVKHIARIHGGDVRATSYLNEGSIFTLTIPTGAVA
jgi:two-component system phosphate regulon sensor histidine kinase PhoR